MIVRVWCNWESCNNFLQTGGFTNNKLDWLTQLLCSNHWGWGVEEEFVDGWEDFEIGRWFSHWAWVSFMLREPAGSLTFAKRMSNPFPGQFQSQMQKSGCTIPGHLVFELYYWEMDMSGSDGDVSWRKRMAFWIMRITFLIETGNAFRICPMTEI